MKTVISVKTDKETKRRAKAVADEIGIPLGTLLNAYIKQIAATGVVHFSVTEPMTPKMERLIAEAEKEIASGKTSGPFTTTEDLFEHLDALK